MEYKNVQPFCISICIWTLPNAAPTLRLFHYVYKWLSLQATALGEDVEIKGRALERSILQNPYIWGNAVVSPSAPIWYFK